MPAAAGLSRRTASRAVQGSPARTRRNSRMSRLRSGAISWSGDRRSLIPVTSRNSAEQQHDHVVLHQDSADGDERRSKDERAEDAIEQDAMLMNGGMRK